MVSDSGDTGFTPLDLSVIDQGDDLLLTPPTADTTTGAFTPNIVTADSPASVLSLITLIGKLIPEIDKAFSAEVFPVFTSIVTELKKYSGEIGTWAKWFEGAPWDFVSGKTPVGWFYTQFLEHGLNVDVSKFDDKGKAGLVTVDSVLWFAFLMNSIGATVDLMGKLPLAHRFGDSVPKFFSKVPEIMGLSWALGMILDRSFENAIGSSLDRNIRRLKRPNEPEWRIARLMLKQHHLDQASLDEILRNEGYSDPWIEKINQLELLPIPIADVSALYNSDIIQDTELDQLIRENGYDGDKLEYLKKLYITKSETSSGAELRSAARQLFKLGHISETEYKNTLTAVNYPLRLIDDDIKAIQMERDNGYRAQLTSTIKNNLLHNPTDKNTAITSLVNLGYQKTDATATVNTWLLPTIRRQHGLTEAQVLKFLAAHIIDRNTAAADLRQLGIDSDAITLLLDNPTLPTGTHPVKATPALVEQAYLVGAIPASDLQSAFENVGLKGDALTYWLAKARYAYSRHHESGSGQEPLGRGDILEAYKYTLMDEPTAIKALNGLGYSTANATLLLEIVNKGPIKPAAPPYFANVSAAIAYLTSLGITVSEGVSQEYESALAMVGSAGYSIEIPLDFVAPTQPTTIPLPGTGTPPPLLP